MTRDEILQAAHEQAKKARSKFWRCENKYAFQQERAVCKRWGKIVDRLKVKEPERFRRKPPPGLTTLMHLLNAYPTKGLY